MIEETITVPWKNKDEFYLSQNIHSVFNFGSLQTPHEIDSAIAYLAEEKGILPLLIRARQSCIMCEMMKDCLEDIVNDRDSSSKISLENILGRSSKLDLVEQHILSRRDTGSKIVFCHFRKEIDVLKKKLITQGLSVVYFVSPHWNPAIEDQAIARCHRIGQTEQIYVFRFEMESFQEKGDDFDENVAQTLDFYCNQIQKTKRGYYEFA